MLYGSLDVVVLVLLKQSEQHLLNLVLVVAKLLSFNLLLLVRSGLNVTCGNVCFIVICFI